MGNQNKETPFLPSYLCFVTLFDQFQGRKSFVKDDFIIVLFFIEKSGAIYKRKSVPRQALQARALCDYYDCYFSLKYSSSTFYY
jgi:hypothetical protein